MKAPAALLVAAIGSIAGLFAAVVLLISTMQASDIGATVGQLSAQLPQSALDSGNALLPRRGRDCSLGRGHAGRWILGACRTGRPFVVANTSIRREIVKIHVIQLREPFVQFGIWKPSVLTSVEYH